MSDRGHIELDRTVSTIVVGERHRRDTGDLTPLMDSMKRVGLLQPVTITPDGYLICGYRRLEAAKTTRLEHLAGVGEVRDQRRADPAPRRARREHDPQAAVRRSRQRSCTTR